MASFWIRSSRTGSFFAFRIVGVIRLPSKRHDLKHNLAKRQSYALTHISSPKAWEGLGATTAPTMFRPSIGGAIYKKGREDYVRGARPDNGCLGPRCEPTLGESIRHRQGTRRFVVFCRQGESLDSVNRFQFRSILWPSNWHLISSGLTKCRGRSSAEHTPSWHWRRIFAITRRASAT